MKRINLSVGVAASISAAVAAAGLLAPPAMAAPPAALAGELVLGPGNLPGSVSYTGAVLSGASAGWNAAWASLDKVPVTPAECKVLYAGLPIPKGTDTAQLNGAVRGANWTLVVSKFQIDLAPLRAALPKCGTFKAVRGPITSEISVRTIAVAGAPDGLGLEFVQKSQRGNQVEYLQSRQYTAVVNGVTMSLRGGRESREPAPFIGADDQVAVDLLTSQISVLNNPPPPRARPVPPPVVRPRRPRRVRELRLPLRPRRLLPARVLRRPLQPRRPARSCARRPACSCARRPACSGTRRPARSGTRPALPLPRRQRHRCPLRAGEPELMFR